jgi:hypothetical protein
MTPAIAQLDYVPAVTQDAETQAIRACLKIEQADARRLTPSKVRHFLEEI